MKKIAIVTYVAGLAGEKGYTRFSYLASLLNQSGFDVDLYTGSFNHWEKKQRNKIKVRQRLKKVDYKVYIAYQPGYKKNVDINRIRSLLILTKNIMKMIDKNNKIHKYALLYCAIPNNSLAAKVSSYGKKHNIPVILDVEDLWPEGMMKVLQIPPFAKVMFIPFKRQAAIAYRDASGFVGTSDEYRDVPLKYKADENKPRLTVYVGCDLEVFEKGVREFAPAINKGDEEFWIIYTGTLGSSYDIGTIVRAAQNLYSRGFDKIYFQILGDGPMKEKWTDLSKQKPCNVNFLGYMPYPQMAAYLSKSDVTVNSFVKSAVQSIVNKVGDYLAAGKPMINTCSSLELRNKVKKDGFGINIEAENSRVLSDVILKLYHSPNQCKAMGLRARAIAEEEFDRKTSYQKIVRLIDELI